MVGTKHKRPLSLRHYIKSLKMLFVLLIIAIAAPAYAHEPLFGLGPHTIYKGGVGIEVAVEGERASNSNEKERELSLHTEIMYGITENLAVTLATPLVLKKSHDEGSGEYTGSGIGDITLRTKYRFWNQDSPGTKDSAAFITGIKLPTGEDGKTPKLGTGSTDFIFGLTAARESLRWYYFGDIRYRLNTRGSGNLKKGDRVFADLAIGIRAWATEYLKPDLVFMAEVNWESLMRDEFNGVDLNNSGGNRVFFAPSFFFTYRNWAVKGGVQIPLYQNLYGDQAEDKYRFKISVETHM